MVIIIIFSSPTAQLCSPVSLEQLFPSFIPWNPVVFSQSRLGVSSPVWAAAGKCCFISWVIPWLGWVLHKGFPAWKSSEPPCFGCLSSFRLQKALSWLFIYKQVTANPCYSHKPGLSQLLSHSQSIPHSLGTSGDLHSSVFLLLLALISLWGCTWHLNKFLRLICP